MVTDLLDKATKVAGVGATVGLLVSVAYDWGTFSALGITFADVPTSIGDHLRSGLVWTTYLLPIALGSLAFGLITRRIEQGMTEEEIAASSRNPKLTRKFRRSADIGMAAMLALIAVAFILIGIPENAIILSLGCALLWQLFVEWVLRSEALSERISKPIRLAVYLGPTVGIFAFVLGFANTSSLVTSGDESARLYISRSSEPICVAFSRAFAQGILVATCQRRVQFLPWEGVERIEASNPVKPFNGLLCRWTKLACWQIVKSASKTAVKNSEPSSTVEEKRSK